MMLFIFIFNVPISYLTDSSYLEELIIILSVFSSELHNEYKSFYKFMLLQVKWLKNWTEMYGYYIINLYYLLLLYYYIIIILIMYLILTIRLILYY